MNKTPLKPALVIQFSNDLDVVCYAKLIGPNGTYVNFEFDEALAEGTLAELQHHLRRHREKPVFRPVEAMPSHFEPGSRDNK